MRLCGLVALVVAASCAGLGCGETTRDYVPDFMVKPFQPRKDPLVVLRNSTNGDERREALLSLNEPMANGGSQQQQELVLSLLKYSALHDTQAVCRLAAIDVLRQFKDPQAVDVLKDAYYRASSFNPETATVIRCQTLDALGQTKNPLAVEMLVKVMREPPVEGSDQDKQQKTDERIAAARALGNFSHYQATAALVEVLRKEQDVALRTGAHQSLVQATGKDLPADAQAWDNLLGPAQNGYNLATPEQGGGKDRFLRWAGWSQGQQGK